MTVTYAIIMVVHNALEMVQLATLRTLRHSAAADARLVVVDNASNDGAERWLRLLAERGDITLIHNKRNRGHGPAIEQALAQSDSEYVVTLDSDAFPLRGDWLEQLRARLVDPVRAVGIEHHRDYIHPSCLMIARNTLAELKLSFLNEKRRRPPFDVAERLSHEVRRQGYQTAGLARTGALRRGSRSEPVYLGSEYEGLVYHQWYTTRAARKNGRRVDDVPADAIHRSLQELFAGFHAEPRAVTVVVGARAGPGQRLRRRNLEACLRALNLQTLPRWRYRIVLVEQDEAPRLEKPCAPLADRYFFAANPGAYNRGWGFNVGVAQAGAVDGALCLIDADILPPPDFLEQGLLAMANGAKAVCPYEAVRYLDQRASEQALADHAADPHRLRPAGEYSGRTFRSAQGGAIWVDAALYRQVGGHDERFRGWGREDREFWQRLADVVEIVTLPGMLLHLYHKKPPSGDKWARANRRLYARVSGGKAATFQEPMGRLDRYVTGVIAHGRKLPGEREWEGWRHWKQERVERIYHSELAIDPQLSARRTLAEIAAPLGDCLLDIGCGPGPLWPHLARYRPRLAWAGVDVTPGMVAAARRFFPDVPVYRASAAALPFDDNAFDVLVARHLFEHIPYHEMVRVLEESTRVARRALVFAFHQAPTSRGQRLTRRPGHHFLEIRWRRADLQDVLNQAGWQVHHRFSISRRPSRRGWAGEQDEVWISTPRPALYRWEAPGPKVSIIMPTYHRGRALRDTVAMVQRQSYPHWELIIVDNGGSAPDGFDDPRIRVVRHPERPSSSYARNQGVGYATGELVCFFDDDDDMFPSYLERLVDTFQAHPKATMVCCGMIVSDGRVNYSYATPEVCLRREFVTATWDNRGRGQDQRYFQRLVDAHGWGEETGEIVRLHEALCCANRNLHGGLRRGNY